MTQIMSARLGIDSERIRIVQGDSDTTPEGMTGGSRSVAVAGAAVMGVADKIIAKGKLVAASAMEASAGDVDYTDGTFRIVGTDRTMSLFDVARAAMDPRHVPKDDKGDATPGLDDEFTRTPDFSTFPNGCHICELEIDPDTGTLEIVNYNVMDDFGMALNPLLLMGQIHGGIGQGVGQALMEKTIYDKDSGQLVSGSFMDYAMPRAGDISHMKVGSNPVPTKLNPLGAKGAGEAGTVGALAAVMNAILDALSPLGVTELQMPATSERVWQAIRKAGGAA